MRLEDEVVRFTIIPDQGTQVWAQLPIVCLLEYVFYSTSLISANKAD